MPPSSLEPAATRALRRPRRAAPRRPDRRRAWLSLGAAAPARRHSPASRLVPTPSLMDPEARSGRRRAALRRRLRRCLGLPARAERPPASPAASPADSARAGPLSRSWSDTEVLSPLATKGARRRRSADAARSPSSSSSSSSSASSTASGARKGVQYGRDGALLCCRFCEILRARDEPFLYEDAELAVFRPLTPAVESHVLVVPRCHIRNVNQLTGRDSPLLRRMRQVAELVLRDMPASAGSSAQKPRAAAATAPPGLAPQSPSSSGSTSSLPSPSERGAAARAPPGAAAARFKLAFHTPPFNSIDHVHMHAFRADQQPRFSCVGAIKYRTATWWCRSFDEVMARLDSRASASTSASATSAAAGDSPRRPRGHGHGHGRAAGAACALPALRPQPVI